jgi:ABC-type lipoprotein export system ATPase subunit
LDNQNQELNSFDEIKDQVIDLLDNDEQEFIYLTGAAGTGKTTLLEVVKADLDKKNDCCSSNWYSCT